MGYVEDVRMRKSTPFAVYAFVGLLASMGTLRGARTAPKPVKIDTGMISGAADANGVMAYKGIPDADAARLKFQIAYLSKASGN